MWKLRMRFACPHLRPHLMSCFLLLQEIQRETERERERERKEQTDLSRDHDLDDDDNSTNNNDPEFLLR
jgi:hypothetical protein